MAQSSLRQFYTIRKRPQEDHGSIKRRKLTEDTRLDIPVVGEAADPLSLPFSQPRKVSTASTSKSDAKTSGAQCQKRSTTTRCKSRGRAKTVSTRQRTKTPPTKQPTLSLVLSSGVTTAESAPSDTDSRHDAPSTAIIEEAPDSNEITTNKLSSSCNAVVSGVGGSSGVAVCASTSGETHSTAGDSCSRPASPPLSEEAPLHLLSTSSTMRSLNAALSRVSPSARRSLPPDSPSAAPFLPPARSRMNLAERMKLASSDPRTISLSKRSLTAQARPTPSTYLKSMPSQRTAERARNLSIKTSVQFTEPQHTALSKGSSTAEPMSATSHGDMVRSLYKLSAKELAQSTGPEARRRVRPSRQAKGKAPVAPSTPQLHQFKSFVVESPTKSPSKQPAYQRHHSLAQPSVASTTPAPDLPLPYKYKVLSEKFRCTDTVVTMLQKRREICTFGKLKQAVEEMTRRKYENRNLAQMKTVYPTAFIFRQEKNIPGVYDRKQFESYQLTVECNVREDGSGGSDATAEEEAKERKNRSNAVLDSSALLRRRKYFNKNIGEIVRQHHKRFLSSLKPPLEIPDEKVLRWHPAFQLDTIADVEETPLPSLPLTESYNTARDVLNVTRERLTQRVQRALENAAGNSEGGAGEGAGETEEGGGGGGRGGSSTTPEVNSALRGVSQKLLEKIQQKEASRVRADITRDPAKERRLEMLARLPDLCRIVRSFFVVEKKTTIAWDSVVQKISESHTSGLPPDRAEQHLEFMQESLGGWLSVVVVRKRRFVKISKNTDTRTLTARMEAVRKKLMA